MVLEFISYDGEYPNLCRGEFVCKIDGVLTKFASKYHILSKEEQEKNNTYPDFWSPGGSTYIDDELHDYITSGPWELVPEFEIEEFPEKIREYLDNLLELFNGNVEYGCCGGCI